MIPYSELQATRCRYSRKYFLESLRVNVRAGNCLIKSRNVRSVVIYNEWYVLSWAPKNPIHLSWQNIIFTGFKTRRDACTIYGTWTKAFPNKKTLAFYYPRCDLTDLAFTSAPPLVHGICGLMLRLTLTEDSHDSRSHSSCSLNLRLGL